MQNIHINKMIKNHTLREENTPKIYAREKINASKWPKLPCYAHIKRRKTKSAQNPELQNHTPNLSGIDAVRPKTKSVDIELVVRKEDTTW